MDMPEEPGEAVTLGDIVISPVVAAAQALQQGHSTEHEIYILTPPVHVHVLDLPDREVQLLM